MQVLRPALTRRRRREGGALVPELTFLAGLSMGASGILGAYAGESAAQSGGTLTSWAPMAGANGPTLAISNTAPTVDTGNGLVVFNGTNQAVRAITGLTGWDLSAGMTLVLVASGAGMANGAALVGFAQNGSAHSLSMIAASTTSVLGRAKDSGVSVSTSGVASSVDATLRLYVVSVTGSTGTLACDVPTNAEVTAAMTGTFSGAATEFVAGRAVGLGASYAAMQVKRLLILNAAPSAGDLALLQTWAPRYAGAVLF